MSLLITALSVVEELKRFMVVAKLQNPTTRRQKQTKQEGTADDNTETVKHEDDGTVTITRMEIQPSSHGRERFGSGTKNWGKFHSDTPALRRFLK